MNQAPWLGEKTVVVGLLAGFFGGKNQEYSVNDTGFISGLTLGWLFSSSVFVNNNVKVVSNKFDAGKDEREDERTVSNE
jgi:hypothetical protein